MLTQGFTIELNQQPELNINKARLEMVDLNNTLQPQQISYQKFEEFILENIYGVQEKNPLTVQDIIDEFFPVNESFDVFISHSHQDVDYAQKLKYHIEHETNVKAFVDDGYWSHYDELVKKFKQNNNKVSEEELFKHIFVILQSALTHVILNSNTFIYLQSENTEVHLGVTLSPIIYHELSIANMILNLSNKMIANESDNKLLTVEYDTKIDNLPSVHIAELINILKLEKVL